MDNYDERDPRILATLAELGHNAEELRNSDKWKNHLQIAARFHTYSTNNQILIGMQCPTATYVAGYVSWQQMGRQVCKDEHGIGILAPTKRVRKDPETGDKKGVIVGFHTVNVFDVSQTEENPNDWFWSKRTKGKVQITNRFDPMPWPEAGHAEEWQLDELMRRTNKSDIGASLAEIPGEARGFYKISEQTITIDEQLSAGGAISTLTHELGHAHDPLLQTDQNRARKELVAESVSFVLCQQLGIDVDDEVDHYLAGWGATAKEMILIAKRVTESVDAVRKILMPGGAIPQRTKSTVQTPLEEVA